MIFTVDFSVRDGKIKKELYGSGLHVFVSNRHIKDRYEEFQNLKFPIVRNHDWALNNPGQRMIDIQHIFPLMHLDPGDPRNYYFAPSDEAIRLVYESGSKVFYRLGTSIEHTEGVHFNANPPEDFEKYAEVCAGVIRHYTEGWCHGFHYDMKYWEIWNEPDGHINMWTGTDEQFAEFFAVVLKRLKKEFPRLKIGGPAHCGFKPDLLDMLKKECDKRNVKPDFYSYHMYANDLKTLEEYGTFPREYLDKIGWKGVKTCINEWHFIRGWGGVHFNVTEESYLRKINSRDGLHGSNSAAFNLAAFCIWQNSPLDMAFYYGCGTGDWGICRPSGAYNKNYYSLLMQRDMVYDYPVKVSVKGGPESARAIAGISPDGKYGAILVSDLCGDSMKIPLKIQGLDGLPQVQCIVLDDNRNNESIDCSFDEDGLLQLSKSEPGSAAFLVTFSLKSKKGKNKKN